ncbi:MAG: antibiotic biosynthesis monooxygenase [Planctomycetaceae bacterium]|jgi:quinol monooxygenase YgiN|nr:antibiotic biosynthesis monooxygenase [Planctomycetaceae bacterium]
MIYVLATIEIADGKRAEFVKIFRDNVANVLAEEGCIEYEPTIDVDTDIAAQPDVRPNVVTVVEKWESFDALEAHLIAPHMLEYRKKVKDLVAGASLQILEPA